MAKNQQDSKMWETGIFKWEDFTEVEPDEYYLKRYGSHGKDIKTMDAAAHIRDQFLRQFNGLKMARKEFDTWSLLELTLYDMNLFVIQKPVRKSDKFWLHAVRSGQRIVGYAVNLLDHEEFTGPAAIIRTEFVE